MSTLFSNSFRRIYISGLIGFVAVIAILLLFLSLISVAKRVYSDSSRLRLRVSRADIKDGSVMDRLAQETDRTSVSLLLLKLAIIIVISISVALKIEGLLWGRVGLPEIAIFSAIIVFLLTSMFGVLIPRAVATAAPGQMMGLLAKPTWWMVVLVTPVYHVVSWGSDRLADLLNVAHVPLFGSMTSEDLKEFIDSAEEGGALDKNEKEMINSIFEFSETIVREIMTPRTDVVCMSAELTIDEAVTMFRQEGHSRIPVYDGDIDNIIGVLYAKDLLGIEKANPEATIRVVMRSPIFIPETKSIENLFQQMRRSKFHIAIVVDEHGGFSGITTFEDIIEEIVGDIQDEYDDEKSDGFTQISTGHYLVEGKTNIDDLGNRIECEFPENMDYDTVAGFVLSTLGKFPRRGERFTYGPYVVTVKETSKRRVLMVDFKLSPSEIV